MPVQPADYAVVGSFENDTPKTMRLYLEMVPQELVLGPGHRVELLARPSPDLLPLTISMVGDGLQIHAHKEFDPDWHVRFNGKLIQVVHPTDLKDHE